MNRNSALVVPYSCLICPSSILCRASLNLTHLFHANTFLSPELLFKILSFSVQSCWLVTFPLLIIYFYTYTFLFQVFWWVE